MRKPSPLLRLWLLCSFPDWHDCTRRDKCLCISSVVRTNVLQGRRLMVYPLLSLLMLLLLLLLSSLNLPM